MREEQRPASIENIARSVIDLETCDEPFVSLLSNRSLLVDDSRSRNAIRSSFYCCVRAGVYERLEHARSLLPARMTFIIKEAYRPPFHQERLYAVAKAAFASRYPGIGEDELESIVWKYVAPVWASGHPTGGAVDLTLALDGNEVDMGSAFNADPDMSEGRTFFYSESIDEEHVERRGILCAALEAAGFVNYPSKWWHWSYGDQYWAYIKGFPAMYDRKDETEVSATLVEPERIEA